MNTPTPTPPVGLTRAALLPRVALAEHIADTTGCTLPTANSLLDILNLDTTQERHALMRARWQQVVRRRVQKGEMMQAYSQMSVEFGVDERQVMRVVNRRHLPPRPPRP